MIDHLRPVVDKKLGVICTQLMFSGDGSSFEREKLEHLGFKMMWGYQINMFNSMTTKGSPFRHSRGYAENRRKLEKVDEKIDKGERRIADDTVLHHALGLTQRPAYRHRDHSSSQHLSCRADRCVKCRKCVRNCPQGVIGFSREGIVFAHPDRCIGCLRCCNFCPEDAIEYQGVAKTPLYKGPTKEVYDELFK